MKTEVRDTSLEAYRTLEERGITVTQRGRIYALFLGNPSAGYTRAEISDRLGLKLSAVCGRVNELVKLSVLKDDAKRRCKISGVMCHEVRLA